MKWLTAVGQAGIVDKAIDAPDDPLYRGVVIEYTRNDSARDRLVKGCRDVERFGSRYDHALEREAESTRREIKDTSLLNMAVGSERRWDLTDTVSNVTISFYVRRTE